MKLFITVSKRGVLVILALLTVSLVLISRVASLKRDETDGSTNALRVSYIRNLGYYAEETAISVKETLIPEAFGTVYEKYNSLQRRADFDLLPYRGRSVTVYTYSLTNRENTVANLIVLNGEIIGGDISSTELDGEMLPLIRANK